MNSRRPRAAVISCLSRCPMSFPSSRVLLTALVLPLSFSPAYAEEESQPDAILVVGQRDRPITVEPRGLSVSLGQKQFDAVNAFNVEDLIKYAPDFFVRTRFIGDNNAVPGFRGTHSAQSARALVMVDGFVVSNFLGNSFAFPPAWGVVSPTEASQFDIVYGPYSARYTGNSSSTAPIPRAIPAIPWAASSTSPPAHPSVPRRSGRCRVSSSPIANMAPARHCGADRPRPASR